MAITQMDTDREVTRALDKLAASYGMSRRQWCADYMKKTVESIPGLMDAVRKEMENGFVAPEPKIEMGKPKEQRTSWIEDEAGGFKDHFKTVKGYRFRYLDETKGFVDGYGTSAGPALKDAFKESGRSFTVDEYYETFFPTPEYVK